MKVRSVICDVYHTLLAVKPPPADAQERWLAFWDSIPGMSRQMGLDEFSVTVRDIIAREHAVSRAAGIAYPEILWPNILAQAVPELANASPEARDDFFWRQAQFLHTVHLMPSAADALRKMRSMGVILGLASNSQPYTLRELDAALASAELSRQLFRPELCFFSFEHGFAKPDAAVFHFLSKQLHTLGVSNSQTMMIGNRLDNDIEPAKAEGWKTWHFTEQASAKSDGEGNWDQFCQWLS